MPIKTQWNLTFLAHFPPTRTPEASALSGAGFSYAAGTYNAVNQQNISNCVPWAMATQLSLSALGLIFGPVARVAIKSWGSKADIRVLGARRKTQAALVNIQGNLDNLTRVLSVLGSRWENIHRLELDVRAATSGDADPSTFLRMAEWLDQHVDDYLELACFIEAGMALTARTVLPTSVDLGEERELTGPPPMFVPNTAQDSSTASQQSLVRNPKPA